MEPLVRCLSQWPGGRHTCREAKLLAGPSNRASTDQRSRDVTEYLGRGLRHSGLMFANLITLAHFSVSSAMSLP
jgi:hypothetical protein